MYQRSNINKEWLMWSPELFMLEGYMSENSNKITDEKNF